MTTEVELCNLALSHLGEAPISALTDQTTAGRACARLYSVTRDEVLRSHRWNFATARATLAAATAPAFGWGYAYTLPADCLRILELNETEEGASNAWAIEGTKLLTNDSTARIVYLQRVADVGLFDVLFQQALSCKLGVALAEVIRGTTGKTEELTARYERVTAPLARRVDANEGKRRKGLRPVSSQAIAARYGAAWPR